MSILIIGGAFLVALLALIGLVIIVRQEVQATARTQQAAADKAAPAAHSKITTPLQPTRQDNVSDAQTAPVAVEAKAATLNKEERLPIVSNGQFNEFVIELRALHEQAEEIEHCLSILTEMVARIERAQNSHVRIQEENFRTEDLAPITK